MNAIQRGLSLLQNIPSINRQTEEKPVQSESHSNNMARTMVTGLLRQLHGGRLAIFENNGVQTFGKKCDNNGINASITVHHADTWQQILTRGSIGAGEAYMDGHWSSPDLTEVIRLLARNRDVLNGLDGHNSLFTRMALKAMHALKRNTPEGARQNISAHYDLDNDFFQLFLDPAMMYSSALFRHPSESLAEAAIHKLDNICQQLQLKPGEHLLEIGTGWGGMAIHAARHYGCRVTTTTISQKQYDFAKARIDSEGLSEQITLLLCDYRDLTGHYDKLVSIEMIEAVGAEFQQTYFEQCDRLLKPGGLALIQAITIHGDYYEQYLQDTDFIRHYIFPGGCLPTVERMKTLTAEHTTLQLQDITDITLHYARTLQHWRQRFLFSVKQVMALGFDLPFIRMWDFYLCYCEGGFLEGSIGTHQLLFRKH